MKIQRGSDWSRWDLHIHSTASDGKATPEEIVDQAIERGLSVIALTDHHTVDNIDITKEIGKSKGLTVIAGVEFRTEYGNKSVHMIGLFPNEYKDGNKSIKLTGQAISENILNPLGLTRTKIIADAKAEDSSIKDDAIAYKAGLLKHQVDFKKAADLIHEYGGLVTVHAGSKSNSLDEEMRHEGSGPKNAEKADREQTRFQTFTRTQLVNQFLDEENGPWGIASVKGIGKTFLLQVKRAKLSKKAICFPNVGTPSRDNYWGIEIIRFTNYFAPFSNNESYYDLKALWKYTAICYILNCWLKYYERQKKYRTKPNAELEAAYTEIVEEITSCI